MYLAVHALKNIVRNKGRYLFIGAVLTVMLASITMAAIIHFTTTAVIEDYADRFCASVYFTPDLKKLLQLGPDENGIYSAPAISSEQLIVFSKSDALKNTLFQGSRQTYGAQLQGFDQGGEESSPEIPGFTPKEGDTPHQTRRRQAPNTVVIGYSAFSMIEEFSLGLRELAEGSLFDLPGECIISRDFADLNGLTIGDTMTLEDVNTETDPLVLTVCGIYNDITTPQPDGSNWAVNHRRNEILTSFATFEQTGMTGVYVTAVYYLKSPELASGFEAYVREHGLHDIYNVNTDSAAYDQIVKPVKGLKRISLTFLIIIFCFGSLVLVLLSMLGVRERKYEIGVLRAMGMSKGKVALGLLFESACVLLLCLGLGLGSGTALAQPVSNAILSEQAKLAGESPEASYGDILSSTENSERPDYSALQHIRVTFTPEAVAFLIVTSLALGLLSNIAGILCITRYEPMKILTERS